MRILIAEDERLTRLKLRRQLEKMGHQVVDACDGQQAWERFQAEPFPIVISDWEMPVMNGVELVSRIRQHDTASYVYIVMLTGKSDKKDVVAGIDAGADDFVSKPFDGDELRARLSAGQRIVDLEHDLATANERLRHELAVAQELSNAEHSKHEESLLGESIPIRALRESIELFAKGDEPLLLSSPPGAGQEAVARAVHLSSQRRDRAFICVPCAHIPKANESIYSFHTMSKNPDRFEKAVLAHGGTLFLQGVETLSDKAQDELASFLKNAASQRAAGARPDPDVRVIASLSDRRDSDRLAFRLHDELHRMLGQNQLSIPSLAERRDDILVIANGIIERRARTAGKQLEGLSRQAKESLEQYSWPGNIRELRSVVERAVLLSSGTLVEVPEELLRERRRVGGYTLERRLGAGGMGEVWLAQHSLLARPSAVKLIRQSALHRDADSREMLEERFQREAMATAQLRSPNTVELYDFGVTDEGDFYYVMEYLQGVDLHSLVEQFGPLPAERVGYLLAQACLSLGEAHLMGLVHRDVKPENLLACQLGTEYDFLKLLDFGIVRTTTNLDQTQTEQIKGTPNCMSPEAAQGEQVTYASDIYGLGCVAYWLLTGRQVFEASTIMSLLLQHVSKQPQPPSDVRSDVPQELDELVLSCLAKNPNDRPSNALELGERLTEIRYEQHWDNRQAQLWWNANLPLDDQVADDATQHSRSVLPTRSNEKLPAKQAVMRQHRKDNEPVAQDLHRSRPHHGRAVESVDPSSGLLVNREASNIESVGDVHSSASGDPLSQASEADRKSDNAGHASPSALKSADRLLDLRPEAWIGRRIGTYKITSLIGVGRMGVVVKAHDTSIERDVAIKILTNAQDNNEAVFKRFLAEAKTAGKLSHQNIVTVHEVAHQGAICYLVMEVISGGTTRDHLRQHGAYSAGDATHIVIQANRGLAAAHKAGLVHRDVRPANLLLTGDGIVKVADFGLAKRTTSESLLLTQPGQLVGTPHYMSPEQCESRAVDARSDVYSLGATYYSLLTGRDPYEHSDPVQVMLAQCNSAPPDPRDVTPSVPAACAQIIEHAMAKRLDQRYESMEAMQSDLEAILATVSGVRMC